MDYRKFKYEQDRKAKAARKNQAKVEVKEMKFRPKIDVGDYETKKGHVLRFLKKGARVKITIMFRGREMAHPEQGLNVLERLAEDLKPFATVESQPKMEGRNMHMLVAPIKGAFDEKVAEDDAKDSDKENEHAQDEDAQGNRQALPSHRYRQAHACQGLQEPHPRQEVPEAHPRLPQGGRDQRR